MSTPTLDLSDVPDNFNEPLTIRLFDRINVTDGFMEHLATHGTFAHYSINSAAKLQKLSKSLVPLRSIVVKSLQQTAQNLGPALAKLMSDVVGWIRKNPGRAVCFLAGGLLCATALLAPAILGAIGFGSLGPVAGSIAAAWQASLGSVAAGSFFAFLQSAGMAGAAVGAITGMGIAGGAIVGIAMLAPPKSTMGGWVGEIKSFVTRKKGRE